MSKYETNKRCFVISPIGQKNTDTTRRSDIECMVIMNNSIKKIRSFLVTV
jgi:hypothetical protein